MENRTIALKNKITVISIVSIILILLMSGVSITELILMDTLYPTPELKLQFYPNAIINLSLGVSILLLSMIFTVLKKKSGLILWTGSLFFIVYQYLTLLLSMPFGILFPFYLLIFTLSLYSLIGLISSTDTAQLVRSLSAKVPVRTAGGILSGLGIILLVRQSSLFVMNLLEGAAVSIADKALWISDFSIIPALIIVGILLWKKKPFAYLSGAALLFGFGMLSVAVIPVFILQEQMKGGAAGIIDITVLIAFALLCLIPFVLFFKREKH